jgi:prepilin-type N-terminal cleavage/methylation domain-containing protein
MIHRNSHDASGVRAEQGFSLPELMIAMTIGLLILFAMLSVFDTFNTGVDATSRATDAEDNGRRNVTRMVRILRDAGAPAPTSGNSTATLIRATDNDVVLRSTSWPGESATGGGTNIERLCLDTTTKTVWFDGRRSTTSGPDDPGSACPSVASGWTHFALATKVANTASLPLFRIGTSPVRTIAIQLRTDSSTTRRTTALNLASGGTMRGSLPPTVTTGDLTVDCTADGASGARKPLVSLNADPGLSGLKLGTTVSGAVAAGPGKVLLAAGTTGTVQLVVTNALGLQTLLFKDIPC